MGMNKTWSWLGILIMLLMIFLSGCKDTATSTVTETQETTTDQSTIFDKVIDGDLINEEGSLYDVTDRYELEAYTILGAVGFEENSLLIAYVGDSDSKVVLYDISSAKKIKTITLEQVLLSSEIELKANTVDFQYIYDQEANTYYYLDVNNQKYTKIPLDFQAESMVVTRDGARIFYTLPDDTNIYQFAIETLNSVPVYDYAKDAKELEIRFVESDNDTLSVYVQTDSYLGYASISIENGTMDKYDELAKDLVYSNGVYIYTTDSYDKSLIIFDKLKPRAYEIFNLDAGEELQHMDLFDGPYLLTAVGDTEEQGSTIRFYDLNQGIMLNQILLSDEYTMVQESYITGKKILCMNTTNSSGDLRIILWDIEVVTDIVS